jgi:hypothetical protein
VSLLLARAGQHKTSLIFSRYIAANAHHRGSNGYSNGPAGVYEKHSCRTNHAARRRRTEPDAPNLNRSERDEIRQRVATFKAHQERFARERDFAASLLKKYAGAIVTRRVLSK